MIFIILQGDALHIPLADESVQCAPTSPPYWGLRDYGLPPTDWPEVEYAPMPGLPPIVIPAMTCCLGLEETPEAYTAHLVAVFREVKRVLRKDGVCWLNLGDSYSSHAAGKCDAPMATSGLAGVKTQEVARATKEAQPYRNSVLPEKNLVGIPWRVAFALQADGWWLRSAIIWAKGISFCDTYSGSTMPESVTDRPTKAHEHIFLLAKNKTYFYDNEAVKEAAIYAGKTVRNMSEDAKNAQMGQYGQTRTGFLGEVEVASTRNLRDVWAISPTPYKAAHFATFSPSLVEPMIKAGSSERGACPRCGAPWERVVERGASGAYMGDATGKDGVLRNDTAKWAGRVGEVTTSTVGWRPTCSCNAGEPVPCIVLDPFSGAGTTVLVADRLGRNGVGLDLSGTYTRMGRDRVFNDAPLLALMGAIA